MGIIECMTRSREPKCHADAFESRADVLVLDWRQSSRRPLTMNITKRNQVSAGGALVETVLTGLPPALSVSGAVCTQREGGQAGPPLPAALRTTNVLEVPIREARPGGRANPAGREACATMRIMKRKQFFGWRRSAETPLQAPIREARPGGRANPQARGSRATMKITKRTQNRNRERLVNQCDPDFGGELSKKRTQIVLSMNRRSKMSSAELVEYFGAK